MAFFSFTSCTLSLPVMHLALKLFSPKGVNDLLTLIQSCKSSSEVFVKQSDLKPRFGAKLICDQKFGTKADWNQIVGPSTMLHH